MFQKMLLLALALLCLFAASAAADALPLTDGAEAAARFAANPRNVKDIGDPQVLCENGEYFLFATGGPVGFNVWRSNDLTAFTKEKAVKKISWVSGDYWAPEVYAIGGRYYMFFTGRWKENESLRIGVAVSDAPEGPYEDAIGAPLFDFGYAAIDGTLVWDDDSTPYMIFSRDCSENIVGAYHESHLYGVQLAEDLLSTVGEPVLLTRPDAPWEQVSGDYRWNEGPAVVRHDGRYYLFYSANYYASKEYTLGVAVSDHPLGPYVKQENNPVLSFVETADKVIVSGPGHNAFFTVGDELFTSYHTHTYPQSPSGNRQVAIDRAGFHADGTAYINGPTLAPQLRPLAEMGLVNHMQTASCDDAARLLTDGDTCQGKASAAYVFDGSAAEFAWESPVTADMLLVYPALGGAISGQVTVNGSLTADFDCEAAPEKPGSFACLTFAPTEITSMTITFDGACGEVVLIGKAR